MAFSGLGLHPTLVDTVGALGFTTPTPIQSQAIPEAIRGRDLLASAATGSGKTAAFLLPILHRLVEERRGSTRALVLAPTRELAIQIRDEFTDLARGTGLTAEVVHGGVSAKPQERAFRKGVDMIVATPGRLLDHFDYDYARLEGLQYLVLDEADRMLDMGFLPDIRRVLQHVPAPRQTLFFSATMPPAIEKLGREILRDPARISLQSRAAPAQGVAQWVYPVPSGLRGALLLELLQNGDVDDALVFTRTKHRANQLCKLLERKGVAAERIHGNRSQTQRTKALDAFKAGRCRVLVATDVAARGIDIDALGHVVNFDLPAAPEDYIHRVGRTARGADATGDAITLVSPEDEADLARIERTLGFKLARVRLDGFDYDAAPETRPGEAGAAYRHKSGPGRRRGGSSSNGSGQTTKGTTPPASSRPRRRRFRRGQQG